MHGGAVYFKTRRRFVDDLRALAVARPFSWLQRRFAVSFSDRSVVDSTLIYSVQCVSLSVNISPIHSRQLLMCGPRAEKPQRLQHMHTNHRVCLSVLGVYFLQLTPVFVAKLAKFGVARSGDFGAIKTQNQTPGVFRFPRLQ